MLFETALHDHNQQKASSHTLKASPKGAA